jgi:2-dehydropantoate 2-reductase
VIETILQISRASDGQLISTLQDIRNGRETEIDTLNLAFARLAQQLQPPAPATETQLLGELVQLKATLSRTNQDIR